MKHRSGIISLVIVAAAVLAILTLFVNYYGDWLWFRHLGFGGVFTTILITKILMFVVFFIIFAAAAALNISVAHKISRPTYVVREFNPEDQITALDLIFAPGRSKYAWTAITLLAAIVMGLGAVSYWDVVLKSLHASKFGVSDPIFSKDAGFYVFRLPLYHFLQGWYLYALLMVTAATLLCYHTRQAVTFDANQLFVYPKAGVHLAILGSLFVLGIAWMYRLHLYDTLYSTRGVAYGTSYTDVHALIPAYWVLVVLALALATTLLISAFLEKWKLIFYATAVFVAVIVVAGWIYPYLLQRYVVKPNEVTKESPYIINNIRFTRLGYGLNKIREKQFPMDHPVTYADIQKNRATIKNIRLWDRRPLIQTYKQLQEIRLYYDFKSVNVDRYSFGIPQEVALAARELPPSQIPLRARTWVNTHLIYTHGYGVVMNPVNEVTAEGMPKFILKDIPPRASVPLKISRPEIYYGEETDTYAIVRSKTKEFDYPRGNQNVYTTYQGDGGVQLSSWLRKIVYAWQFSDIKILLTGYVTDHSRIMLHRIITDRDETIAPFLSYDSDPYIVVGEDGRLYWIHDAYTTSNMYPYSEPITESRRTRGFNYIRNSVKVVIDAFNGKVSYYVVDPDDPMVRTYQKIFPSLFKPISAMPAFLKKHLRYPTDLFTVQAEMYNVYHMKDPKVFYNQEDLWNIPHEIYQGKEQKMIPYYIIMKLPGASSEEFILMLPLTPSRKNNMVSWMCARCDGEHYGELVVYKLSKEKLIYGPMQMEARINQKPDISSKLTLWGQKGSSVIRGNLLIIPIDQSFIYVEPVYLQSEQSEMPELKRVVVAFGEQLEMRTNLDRALRAVFKVEGIAPKQTQQAMAGHAVGILPEMARKALDHYNRALEALRAGNWGQYGQELNQVKRILEDISRKR